MSVPAAATEKQVQCTGTRPHAPARTPQPALTPDSDGGTTRPVYRTTPAPHPATYAARACICLRHAPRPGLATRLPPPLRAAPRGVSLPSPVPAHISVCLSPLPVRGTGSAPAAAGVTGTGLVSTRGRPAHHVPIYTKERLALSLARRLPVLGMCLARRGGLISTYAGRGTVRGVDRAATPTAARANCVAERGR
jgi:hypothetical protein